MQTAATPKGVVLYSTPVVEELQMEREGYVYLQNQINYMGSRLQAALQAFADQKEKRDNDDWWVEGMRYEIVRYCSFAKCRLIEQSCQVAALAIAGDALTSNIYLDIPPLISGLRNSFMNVGANPTRVILSDELLKLLQEIKPDPKDPTSVVEKYLQPWWTRAAEQETERFELCNVEAAFEFHENEVSWVPALPFPH